MIWSIFIPTAIVNSHIAQVDTLVILEQVGSDSSWLCGRVFKTSLFSFKTEEFETLSLSTVNFTRNNKNCSGGSNFPFRNLPEGVPDQNQCKRRFLCLVHGIQFFGKNFVLFLKSGSWRNRHNQQLFKRLHGNCDAVTCTNLRMTISFGMRDYILQTELFKYSHVEIPWTTPQRRACTRQRLGVQISRQSLLKLHTCWRSSPWSESKRTKNPEVSATCLWPSAPHTKRGLGKRSRNVQWRSQQPHLLPEWGFVDMYFYAEKRSGPPRSFWNSNKKSLFSRSSVFILFDLPQNLYSTLVQSFFIILPKCTVYMQ